MSLIKHANRPKAVFAGPILSILAFAVICAIGWRYAYQAYMSNDPVRIRQFEASIIYSRTVIASNYFDNGFVRRGLGGSIARLLSPNWKESAALFTMFSAAWLALPICVIIRRLAERVGIALATYLAAVVCLSPQTFLGWSLDYARTDMLVASFVAWTAVLIQERRMVPAALCLLTGSLAHETAIIFGLPLLWVLARDSRDRGCLDDRAVLNSLFLLGLGLAGLYACQVMFSVQSSMLARYMLSAAPSIASERMLDDQAMAVHMQVQGLQGVKEAICLNLEEGPKYLFWSAMALVTLGAYWLVLPSGRKPLLFLIGVIAPSLFLLVVANDVGRWAQLSVFNAWLLSASLTIGGDRTIVSLRRIGVGSVILASLLLLGSSRYDRPFRLHRFTAAAAYLPDRELYTRLMDRCAPGWRSALPQAAKR